MINISVRPGDSSKYVFQENQAKALDKTISVRKHESYTLNPKISDFSLTPERLGIVKNYAYQGRDGEIYFYRNPMHRTFEYFRKSYMNDIEGAKLEVADAWRNYWDSLDRLKRYYSSADAAHSLEKGFAEGTINGNQDLIEFGLKKVEMFVNSMKRELNSFELLPQKAECVQNAEKSQKSFLKLLKRVFK